MTSTDGTMSSLILCYHWLEDKSRGEARIRQVQEALGLGDWGIVVNSAH